MDVALLLALCSAAFLAASIGIVALWYLPRFEPSEKTSIFVENLPGAVLIFDDGALIDSTPDARALLADSLVQGSDWSKLLAFLTPRFDRLEEALSELPIRGSFELAAKDTKSSLQLRAEHSGGLVRISLVEEHAQTKMSDPLSNYAMKEELAQLRATIASAPLLAWRESKSGDVIWANGPYLLRACSVLLDGKDLRWPLPKLFESVSPAQENKGHRQSISSSDGGVSWFDVETKVESDGYLRFASPVDAVVQAETALREFMQTLTKTFAQLPIGLAIFDRDRKLQLFNPAMLDLTHLPVDFLSRRPTLIAVLNMLRERKMLPEPKNYSHWRREILDMERAAALGQFEETWNLPDGQTYKVVGRPHPNGALALMIEDISNEMRQTRRYRADLELGQAVVDQMPDAIAVFSQTGQLVMSNTGYSDLWNHAPNQSLGENNAKAIAAHWRNNSAPTKLWAEVEEYIATVGDRESWESQARLTDGRSLHCRFAPLDGGSTLAVFRTGEIKQEKTKPGLASANGRRRA